MTAFRDDFQKHLKKMEEAEPIRQVMTSLDTFMKDGRLVSMNLLKLDREYREIMKLDASSQQYRDQMGELTQRAVGMVRRYLQSHAVIAAYIKDNLEKVGSLTSEQDLVVKNLDILLTGYNKLEHVVADIAGSGPMQTLFGVASPVLWDKIITSTP